MTNTAIKKPFPTVLLVDDSSVDNFVNAKIISFYHFADSIIEFTKAKKALKYIEKINFSSSKTEQPFLLFLDLNMPEMSGVEFLSAFNLLPEVIKKNFKIIVLTSSSNPADVEECKKIDSVIAFFCKPLINCDLEELEQILSKKCEISS